MQPKLDPSQAGKAGDPSSVVDLLYRMFAEPRCTLGAAVLLYPVLGVLCLLVVEATAHGGQFITIGAGGGLMALATQHALKRKREHIKPGYSEILDLNSASLYPQDPVLRP